MNRIFIKCLIENGIALLTAFLQLLLTRWMLDLSSIKEDLRWLEVKGTLFSVPQLKWYRFPEYIHQVKFRRIIHDSYQF
jgi:hypothetical protein